MTDFEHPNNQNMNYAMQVNDEVLDHAESFALGSLYQSVSHAIGLGALNGVSAQQQSNITAQAVVTMGVTTLYSLNTALDSLFVALQKSTKERAAQ